MARTIILKYSGYCRECSAPLPVGTKAKWLGRGVVYGITCHSYNVEGVLRGIKNTMMGSESDLAQERQASLSI